MKLQETQFAYSVGRIRANELRLFTQADMDALVQAASVADVRRLLADKGWHTAAGDAEMLEQELQATWQLLEEVAPQGDLFAALVVEQDFQNLKGALKAHLSGETPARYMAQPSLLPAQELLELVTLKQYDRLPDYLREAAVAAYDAITRLESGMRCDLILDRAALETKLRLARDTGSALFLQAVQLECAAANVKIALRAAKTGREKAFALDAMCAQPLLSNEALYDAALGGTEELLAFLHTTPLDTAAQALTDSITAFEKECEQLVLDVLQAAKYTAFGPDPVVAYYYARTTEIKNVRILLSAKAGGLDKEEITKRMRRTYV